MLIFFFLFSTKSTIKIYFEFFYLIIIDSVLSKISAQHLILILIFFLKNFEVYPILGVGFILKCVIHILH